MSYTLYNATTLFSYTEFIKHIRATFVYPLFKDAIHEAKKGNIVCCTCIPLICSHNFKNTEYTYNLVVSLDFDAKCDLRYLQSVMRYKHLMICSILTASMITTTTTIPNTTIAQANSTKGVTSRMQGSNGGETRFHIHQHIYICILLYFVLWL